ncbi:hypothetical protein NE865_01499 [Phthorimaea operculella]|nr:hypothetical protein NE865_01499 [Phthorimaea operculella]
MDFAVNTEKPVTEYKLNQENTLLDIVKEICSGSNSKLNPNLKDKVCRIIADCDLKNHSSLQRVSTADESTSTVLGFMHQTTSELTYDEQADLNQAFIENIEKKLPACINELENLRKTSQAYVKCREDYKKELKARDDQLDMLKDQESEQMELMMEWLNHRIHGITKYGDNSTELLGLKAKILNLKAKILHLQILQNIFTETNMSIKAYSEIHKDLKDSIKETENRIKTYREIIDSDLQ